LEEAMKHSTWLQERTPAHVLNGKTPYEIKNKKKPHLADIHELGAVAYIKVLKAGELGAQVGQFIGYDSESKEYYNGVAIIAGDVLAEGERDKIIQNPTPTAHTNKPNVNHPELEAEKSDTPDLKPTNTIPFPSELHPTNKPEEATMEEEDTLPQLGRGHHVQMKPPGASQCMAEARPPL
jgi:hypothetical protein